MLVKWGFNHQTYGTTDESRVAQTQIGENRRTIAGIFQPCLTFGWYTAGARFIERSQGFRFRAESGNFIIERGPGKINYRTKIGNVRKMGENRIIEQQRSDKNYRTGPGKH